MGSILKVRGLALAAILVLAPALATWAQGVNSTPVDLSAYWNVDGYNAGDGDDAADPLLGEMYLDDGGKRIRSWTFPADYVDGEPAATVDGRVEFLLGPVYEQEALDSYRPDGSVIEVPEGAYDRLFLAVMSGNGEFPGSQWDGADIMTANYADGSAEEIPIGVVNDWFWSPPEWYVPASGDPGEVLVDLLMHPSDPNEFDHLWGWGGAEPSEPHNYGQYRAADGVDGWLTYRLPYEDGATMYVEMWGNVQVLVSTDDPDFDPDFPMTEIYNSVAEDQLYPGGGDGYTPNRAKYEFDLSEVVPEGTEEVYVRFRDAAPGEAADVDSGNWGPRIHRLGLFTGPVELSSSGKRLFDGLVRDGDGAAPDGGLILIYKEYRLDPEKTLQSVAMPELLPDAAPFLTVFGMTLGTLEADVDGFMLY